MSLDDALIEETGRNFTPLRRILHGKFAISQGNIPYYQGLMSLEEIEKELSLVEELPSDFRQKWTLEELFQREIDWKRVQNEILDGYLRRPTKLQFFNSLTVALIPTRERKVLLTEYGESIAPPEVDGAPGRPPWKTVDVGDVQVITNPKTTNGYIRWCTETIFAAVIDGQHRLAALKELVRGGNVPSDALKSQVSVLFLVLDERVGFKRADAVIEKGDNPILKTVRELFIDLNRRAEKVERPREILLDDQEIESRCVRRLLAPKVGEDSTDELPLGLVHWQHNVTAKFNSGESTGPFITTVDLLYLIVSDILGLKVPKNPFDESEIKTFVQTIEDALAPSRIIRDNPTKYPKTLPLLTYVTKNYLRDGFERPFVNLPEKYRRACDEGFDAVWKRIIVTTLRDHSTYAEFRKEVDKRSGITGDLAFYMTLPRRAQARKLEEWKEDADKIINEPLRELKAMKRANWCFYAVFQKALLRTAAVAYSQYGTLPGRKDGDLDSYLKEWIAFCDRLATKGLMEVHAPLKSKFSAHDELWIGIALNPGGRTVRWSESTVRRISSILLLWWFMRGSSRKQPASFLKAAKNDDFPGSRKAVGPLMQAVKPIVKERDEEIEIEEHVARCDVRIIEVLRAGGTGK